MATDLGMIIANLMAFDDFRAKEVVHVGVGPGQLLGYAGPTRSVVAVDRDPEAIQRLERMIAELALGEKVAVITGDFFALELRADVVLLEFCLHEMPNPGAALERARKIASDVVVIDHAPESKWAWYANEQEEVARAWTAVAGARPRRETSYEALQRFGDERELRDRLSSCGPVSLQRIRVFLGHTAIAIPMPYRIALL